MKTILRISLGIAGFIIITCTSHAMEKYIQNDTAEKDTIQYDTIVRLGGRRIICDVHNVRSNAVYYALPDKPNEKLEISRKNVQKILYKNGRIEVFNQPVVMMVEEGDWKAVVVTDDPEVVNSMFKRGKVFAESSASARSIKAAKRSATIKVQKKTANIGGNVLLIDKAEAKGGFGDFPSYTIEGTAYSFEPPKPGDPGYEDK
jgi:hypothetical protein